MGRGGLRAGGPRRQPGEAEDGIDATDEDCDGSVLIRHDYVSAMIWAGGVGVGKEWNVLRASAGTAGTTLLDPVPGGPADMTLKDALAFHSGEIPVDVVVPSIVDASCTLPVTGTGFFGGGATLGAGLNHATPPRRSARCASGAPARGPRTSTGSPSRTATTSGRRSRSSTRASFR